MLDLDSIAARLAAASTSPAPADERTRQAAVAVVLRAKNGQTEMLFIKRAEKAGDPWSGHMAFPGGHREPQDASLQIAAIRETAEEIGLDIADAPMLGALPPQEPQSVRRSLLVAPFVFKIDADPVFALNHEVAEAVWTPLAPMYHGHNADRSTPPFDAGAPTDGPGAFNGYRLSGGHFVWGMTYRMVQTFFETIDPDYRRRPDY